MVGGVGRIPPPVAAAAEHGGGYALADSGDGGEQHAARLEHFVQRGDRGGVIEYLEERLNAENAIEEVSRSGGGLREVEGNGALFVALVDVDDVATLDAAAAQETRVFVVANFGHAAANEFGVGGQKVLDVIAVDRFAVVEAEIRAVRLETAEDGPVGDSVQDDR